MGSHEVYVVLSDGHTPEIRMAPGALVGRLRGAQLRIDDPRVSEAHAYVSLREGELRLLALRGGLAVNGRLVREVCLTKGMQITLAKGEPPIVLSVVEVEHPRTMLALRGLGLADEALSGRCLSLVYDEGELALAEGAIRDAAYVFWTDGQGWVGRRGDDPPASLEVGQRLAVGDGFVDVVEIELRKAHTAATDLDGILARPVRIEGYFDTVHLHRQGQPALVLTGAPARLIYELGTIGQPVCWRDVATTLWPDDVDVARLRKRWDVLMVRLRKRLADAAIRPSLVAADGGGKVRLLLERQDTFQDHG